MKNSNTVYFFPKYTSKGPSSRYRTYRYLKYLDSIDYKISPLFSDNYLTLLFKKSKKKYILLLGCYFSRFLKLIRIPVNSVIIVEKEFFPYIPFVFEKIILKKFKVIYDFDDAIYCNYQNSNSKLIRKVLKDKIAQSVALAQGVITGSPELTNYFLKISHNVIEIPTSIDLDDYRLIDIRNYKKTKKDLFTIGWIGSVTTSKYIMDIIEPLKAVLSDNENVQLVLVGFDKSLKDSFAGYNVIIKDWSAQREVEYISLFNVGIMPLDWKPFTRGKCGFKLIQYMACEIPTISTPLEANLKINRNSNNIFANSDQEWIDNLKKIINDLELFQKTSICNRQIVEKYYSFQVNHVFYTNFIKKYI